MSNKPIISIIVATALNNCIGLDNDLPWHIPADLKRFKEITIGKPVIMGRKTFQSIHDRLGKPLPDRTNIIVSRSGFDANGTITAPDIETAIEKAKETGTDEIMIIGGAQIYDLALPHANRLYLTRVHTNVDGDAFFPPIDQTKWKEISKEDFPAGETHPAYTNFILER